MYKTKNLGLNITEIDKDRLSPFNFDIDLGDNFKAIDEKTITHRNITNCLLEVPQRIKYELVDGTLTIQVGSVVIVPYGVEDLTSQYPKGATFLNDYFKVYDTQFAGGKFFVWVELQSNLSTNSNITQTNLPLTLKLSDASILLASNSASGATTPTATTSHIAFYNTTENKCYQDSGTWEPITAPVMIVDRQSDIGISNVNQVFSGFGYIGSAIWVDKGIKGLISYGRNEDGSLKNVEFTTSRVEVNEQGYSDGTFENILTFDNYIIMNGGWAEYKERENFLWDKSRNTSFLGVPFCKITVSAGRITAFEQMQPFHAVDYNDYQTKITELETKIQALQDAITALQG